MTDPIYTRQISSETNLWIMSAFRLHINEPYSVKKGLDAFAKISIIVSLRSTHRLTMIDLFRYLEMSTVSKGHSYL